MFFRLAIAVLAVIGLVSLFTGGVSAAAAGAGFLLLLPVLFLAKILFFVVLFGFIGRGFSRRRYYEYGSPWERRERPSRRPREDRSREDDFDDWHRMAHAREEVDEWVPDLDE